MGPQLVHARLDFVQLHIDLAQLVGHILIHPGRDAGHLQPGLTDRFPRLGDLGPEGPQLTVQLGGGPLQRPHPGQGGEALFGEAPHTRQLLLDQALLLDIGDDLALIAGDLLIQLGDALAQHTGLGGSTGSARAELLLLDAQGLAGQPLVLNRQVGELGGAWNTAEFVAFGDQPGPLGDQGEVLAGGAAFDGLELAAGQLQQDLAAAHRIALSHQQGAHNPALAMLHGLAIARNGDLALGIGTGIEGGQRGPTEEDHKEQDNDRAPDDQLATGVVEGHGRIGGRCRRHGAVGRGRRRVWRGTGIGHWVRRGWLAGCAGG